MTRAGPIRIALLATSPIYYQIPLYRRLAVDPKLDLTVIYASNIGLRPYDGGFGAPVTWNVDLLGGYRHVFLDRAERNSGGEDGFFGLRDFDVIRKLRTIQSEVLWLAGYAYLTHQLAAWWQRFHQGPLLLREEQTLLHGRPPWKQLLKQVGLSSLLHDQRGLYIGSLNKQWFESLGVPPRHLHHVPYAVDNDVLSTEAQRLRFRRDSIRASFGISDNSGPVILFVGRLVEKKEPQMLVEAFRRVRQFRQCSLLIVGAGPVEGTLRRVVRDEKIQDVHFAGFLNQPDIPRAYAAADMFVLPSSRHETWGVVVNEAMNFQLPVILSDKVGSARDLVDHGSNGFVFPSGDVAALAGHLRTLVQSPDLRTRMGSSAAARVAEFSYDAAHCGALDAIRAAVGEVRWKATCP